MNDSATSSSGIRNDLIYAVGLATVSLVLGLVINQFRDKPLPLIYSSKAVRIDQAAAKLAESPKAPAAVTAQTIVLAGPLALDRFREYVDKKQGIVLDARPEIFHRLGHVPGAISLPRDDFEARYEAVKDKLEVNKAQPLAVYCASASCEDADLLSKGLAKLGYTNVAVFTGGWAEWTSAGMPEEKNE